MNQTTTDAAVGVETLPAAAPVPREPRALEVVPAEVPAPRGTLGRWVLVLMAVVFCAFAVGFVKFVLYPVMTVAAAPANTWDPHGP
jgi:hypothetical protein